MQALNVRVKKRSVRLNGNDKRIDSYAHHLTQTLTMENGSSLMS